MAGWGHEHFKAPWSRRLGLCRLSGRFSVVTVGVYARAIRSVIKNRVESARGFLVSDALQHRLFTGSAVIIRNDARNEAKVLKWGSGAVLGT